MPRRMLGINVLDEAVDRMARLYSEGHRVVVSFSTGKDSTVALEVCILAAQQTGRLPVEVVMRDEEIMFPDTYEFAERTAARDEVEMTWLVANQPVINVFNRQSPYFWVLDPELPEDKWMRKPPSWVTYIPEKHIDAMTHPDRFPPPEGKNLYAVIGLRADESRHRLYGLFTSGGYITKPNKYGVANVRPIYDWTHRDVWKMISELKLDYNRSYDVMLRNGLPPKIMRIGPPTMNIHALDSLQMAARAWPKWFDRVCERLPGTRNGVKFGQHALMPSRKLHETWEECFHRTCIDEAPDWIAERATRTKEVYLNRHKNHASTPFPEVHACMSCTGNIASWKKMSMALYNGDPFSLKASFLKYIEPEFFREGAGTWGGKPSF